jgi:hypothetical protein
MKRGIDDTKKPRAVWTTTEDDALLKAVAEDQQNREGGGGGGTEDEEDWDEIAKSVPGRTPVQCLKRYMALNKKEGGGTITASTPASESLSKTATAAGTTSVAAAPAASVESSTSNVKVEAADALAAQYDEYEGNDDDDDDDEDGPGGERSKRARKDGDASAPSWPQDEIDLLKKLVEQYKDSTYTWISRIFLPSWNIIIIVLLIFI